MSRDPTFVYSATPKRVATHSLGSPDLGLYCMTRIKNSQYLFYIPNLKILVISVVKSTVLQINYCIAENRVLPFNEVCWGVLSDGWMCAGLKTLTLAFTSPLRSFQSNFIQEKTKSGA